MEPSSNLTGYRYTKKYSPAECISKGILIISLELREGIMKGGGNNPAKQYHIELD
jgi:hypothetical protein